MAITGTGTQAAPYKPATWDEFLSCTTSDGVYTELPEGGGVFDMNDYYVDGQISAIPLKGYINGNNWTIKNAKVVNTSGRTGQAQDSGFVTSAAGSGLVTNLNFLDFNIYGNDVPSYEYASACLIHEDNFNSNGCVAFCRFAGTLHSNSGSNPSYVTVIDNSNYSGKIRNCSFNLKCIGCCAINSGRNWRAELVRCNIKIDNTVDPMPFFGGFNHCYIQGDVSIIETFTSSGVVTGNSIFNVNITDKIYSWYGSPSLCLVNTDKCSGTISSGFTGVTTAQLKDKEYLNSIEFTISDDPAAVDLWHIDQTINDGFPYIPSMIGLAAIQMYIQPSRPLIHAYGSRETGFNGNGYAMIEPVSCEVHHEKNGVYEANFEAYCDKYRKFTYLRKQAQVKIPMRYHGRTTYQIFRIRQVNRRMDEAGNYRITATAQHKFYDLSRRLIMDCRPTQLAGNAALEWLFTHGWYGGSSDPEFVYSSDISQARTAYYQNCSVTAALLGVDQCFVNRWGGCLYRDNNRFSINSEMEGCQKSGVIMYSYNMTEIDFEEDDSELITILVAEDNFGNTLTLTNPDVPTDEIPHHIYGYARFTYETEDAAAFQADAQAYFDEHKQSKINITVRFANLSDLEKYKEFLQLDDFEVGDKVTIYHRELDIYYSDLEIISKTFDVVAQKTMEIQIGSFRGAITRRAYMADTVSSGDSVSDKSTAALTQDIFALNTNTMASSIAGMENFAVSELEKRTISQLEGS